MSPWWLLWPFGEQTACPGVFNLLEEMGAGERIPPEGEDPDLELVMAAKDGDQEAFERIVRKYQGPAFNIALRMISDREEARDLTQDVFIKVFRALASFRSESRFSHWFYTVLLNACRSRLKHLRRRGFYLAQPLDDTEAEREDRPRRQYADPSPDAAAEVEKRQLTELVEEKMRLVPEEFRDVLVLRDVQGLAYEEIAVVLGIQIGTVKSRLHRGRMVLKELLAPEMEGMA